MWGEEAAAAAAAAAAEDLIIHEYTREARSPLVSRVHTAKAPPESISQPPAGVPVVAMPLERMASRVSASLLAAAGESLSG